MSRDRLMTHCCYRNRLTFLPNFPCTPSLTPLLLSIPFGENAVLIFPLFLSSFFPSQPHKMPDMPAVFQPSTSPARVDLSNANSQLFRVPSTASASSSLYSLSMSRKRPRRNTEKLPSKFEAPSPSPLLESDYRQTTADEGYHASAELDYRPNRYREFFLPPSLDGSVESINQDAQGGRKRSRRDSCVASPSGDDEIDTSTPVGWGRTVIKAVGKVLDICWSGAFRGFHSGGGKGYDLQAGPPTQFNPSWQSPSGSSAETEQYYRTPIPGQFPEDEIERSWVVIPTEPSDPFVSNDSASSPSLRARRVHQASSPRRRPAIMPRLNKRATASSLRPSTPSRSPGLASPRPRDGPGSADMQRYAAQLRRKEREEDASIRRLNKQLQAMIREGKEALGTTVEVDDVDMDCD